ncbi:WD domain repeat-containing protein 55 [Coemansia guatemalensis]|uniref:WD repeat-containing protein JIP5 n=1 Tax=Coemansia guatemalensis TaxID=2761395 RepID=A0A9W8HY23_9FUNG|nr:WD domain repeat-containing protein 55 [Coemansia guatemalensis]
MDNSVARPKSLKFKEPVIDVAFSPTADLVASSLITGHVFVHRYSVDGNTRQQRRKVHKKSCRSVCFSGDGEILYTGSKDRTWQAMDVETGAETMRIAAAHDKPIDIIKYVNEQTVATGDEAGNVKLWDVRKKKQAFAYKEHVDYISDMEFCQSKRHLLATSGDGCLSVYDVRKAKPFHVSANQDDELLSLAIMRGGKKVVVGETDGVLGIFSYGQFGDVSDRFPGHPQSIDAICKLTEDLCVTGSSDGLLRIVQLFPHKLVGVAGDHQALPVEKVVLSYDQQWLASCSHDHMVHFWDIGYIFNDAEEEEEEAVDDVRVSDDELDAQAVAIRISKDIGGGDDDDDESEVDIDGCSDGSELKPGSKAQLSARAESPDADVDASNSGDNDGGGGWGSWGSSSSDDGAGSSARKADRRGKAKAKAKLKRKISSEPFGLSKQRRRKDGNGASFFSGL